MFKVGGMPCFKAKKKPSCKHWTSTGLQNNFTKVRNAVAKQGECFYEGIGWILRAKWSLFLFIYLVQTGFLVLRGQ